MTHTLITCATSQIGADIARSCMGNVTLTGNTHTKLEALCKELGTKSYGVLLDFFDSDIIESAAKKILLQGKIDKLVFILPRIPPNHKVFPSETELDLLYSRYFIKPLQLLRSLFEAEAMNDGGKIVFLSGLSTKSALGNYSTNNCIRNAWLGQAKSMATVLGKRRISVNTLSLGAVMTDSYIQKMEAKARVNSYSLEQQMEIEVSNVPMEKYATTQEVASAVMSLLGPMTDHMTGQNLLLDGGFFKGY